MQLLFATTHLPPDTHFGGVVHSSRALLEALRARHGEVRACCVSARPAGVAGSGPRDTLCVQSRLMHRWGFSPGLAQRMTPLVRQADIVAVNGILSYPMTVAGLLCRRLGKPCVVSVRGGLLPNAAAQKAVRKKLFYHLFVRPILQGAGAVQVTSMQEYDCIAALGLRTPITVIPNGSNLPPEPAAAPQLLPESLRELARDVTVVLFMGRIEPIKGLDILLDAWALLKERSGIDNCRLVIAGPDERGYVRRLQQQAERLGVAESVCFPGMISAEMKWPLYRRAAVFVLPSRSENFGQVVTEALGSRTPVITTTGTPWQELAEADAGRWVAPERGALAGALRELLCLPEERRRAMGERGRKLVTEKYTWDAAARRLLHVCEHILAGSAVPDYIPRR